MPFRAELEPIYQIIKEAGQRAGLRVMRADEMVAPGQITAQISDAIARAGLIVADITSQNANVLFEIGMATSLGKTILNQSFELTAHQVFAMGGQAQGICYTST